MFETFDPTVILETVKDPATGIQVLAVLVLLNVFLGVMVARRQGAFNRDFLLTFAQTRLLEQMLPAAASGYASIYLNIPLLLAVYAAVSGFMVYDLVGDIKVKAVILWTRKQG